MGLENIMQEFTNTTKRGSDLDQAPDIPTSYFHDHNAELHFDIPTKYERLIGIKHFIATDRFFDTSVDVDYWYHAFTYIPYQQQQWVKDSVQDPSTR